MPGFLLKGAHERVHVSMAFIARLLALLRQTSPVGGVYRLSCLKLCAWSAAGRLFDMIAGREGVDEAPSDSHTTGHADSPDSPTSVKTPPQPPLQSEMGQQQAAAVEGQTHKHVNTRQGASDTEGVPEETALKSDGGQQQAASGKGQAARHGSSSGRLQMDDAQMFASQHSVQNEAPREQESMFAEPFTTDRQIHHDGQAADGKEAVNDQSQTHHAQTFALQHQVNNEAPGNQNSMFAEPLASDSQQHQQEAVPADQQATADRLHTRDIQTGVPQGQAGGATQLSQLDESQSQGSGRDEPQAQGFGRDEPQASASQVDSAEQHEQENEQEHQSLAGDFTSTQSLHVCLCSHEHWDADICLACVASMATWLMRQSSIVLCGCSARLYASSAWRTSDHQQLSRER